MYQFVPSPFEPAFAGSIQACYTSTDWGGSGFGCFFFHNQNGLEWKFRSAFRLSRIHQQIQQAVFFSKDEGFHQSLRILHVPCLLGSSFLPICTHLWRERDVVTSKRHPWFRRPGRIPGWPRILKDGYKRCECKRKVAATVNRACAGLGEFHWKWWFCSFLIGHTWHNIGKQWVFSL